MPKYIALDRDGRELKIGDKITTWRGEVAFWEGIEWHNELNGTTKVMIRWEGHGCILTKYSDEFDLTIKEV